ncbi:MAG: cation diffusion facilitator family transporter [Candidatus Borkfalkiaceae bacterium]|nr:cation diffusion facilitator family transporter [Clostridia bacterium]MDY6223938.1 cation diffusion facilitator family transporter [Christensenellaceae bacterium]
MINALLRLFGCVSGKGENETVNRNKCASFATGTGIVLNLLLFAAKLTAGILAASVAVISDAFNNASDAGSSLVALIGFKMAAKAGDKEHPLGHGRMEYVTGFIVDMLVIFVGAELIKTSVQSIITPELPSASALTVCFLCFSILAKTWLFVFYKKVGKKIESVALQGAAIDSVSDVVATSVVLISALCGKYLGWKIDGVAGLLVACFILFSGLKAAKETVDLLLGAPPKKEFIDDIYSFVKNYPEVLGIHDVIVHDYGPGRTMVSFHAEVSAEDNINYAHEAVDKLEEDMHKKFGCLVTVHMDPIVINDEHVNELREFVARTAKEVDDSFTVHDFRMTYGKERKNLIFDLCVPMESKCSLAEAQSAVADKIHNARPDCYAVIRAEHPLI